MPNTPVALIGEGAPRPYSLGLGVRPDDERSVGSRHFSTSVGHTVGVAEPLTL